MPDTDIGSASASDLNNAETSFSVNSETTDATAGSEFRWQMENWAENLGYYKLIPELQIAIDAKANWTIGAGYEAEPEVELQLLTIKGNGKDSFNSILANQIRTYTIGGDSFAEIIRDKNGIIINLKSLDPSSIVIIQSGKGRIVKYEQVTKQNKLIKSFEPHEMLHLSRKRVADEIHGISIIPSVEWIILARNEAMADMKKLMHRHVIPRMIYQLDTDDTSKIAEFKAKEDAANSEGENIYIPKGAVEVEPLSIAPNATLNPLTWIQQLNDYFFQVVNVPQIIVGNAKEFTDASGKIVYLAYEQSVKGEQLYIEEQILGQLNIPIKLTFPASLQTDAISDTPTETDQIEEEPIEGTTQPNDTTEELEGQT
jgi:hypothetical protein|tara:strand:+ start:3088 stop:4200 length:1113 start_codon:yes stop_codon:yes gene_type:complete